MPLADIDPEDELDSWLPQMTRMESLATANDPDELESLATNVPDARLTMNRMVMSPLSYASILTISLIGLSSSCNRTKHIVMTTILKKTTPSR